MPGNGGELHRGPVTHGQYAVQSHGEIHKALLLIVPVVDASIVEVLPILIRAKGSVHVVDLDYGSVRKFFKHRGIRLDGDSQVHGAVGRIVHCIVHHLHPPRVSGDILLGKGISQGTPAVPGYHGYLLPVISVLKPGVHTQAPVQVSGLLHRHQDAG